MSGGYSTVSEITAERKCQKKKKGTWYKGKRDRKSEGKKRPIIINITISHNLKWNSKEKRKEKESYVNSLELGEAWTMVCTLKSVNSDFSL